MDGFLNIPEAIAILGICGTIATAIIKFVPTRTNGVSKEICSEKHKHIGDRLMSIEKKLDSMDEFLRGGR